MSERLQKVLARAGYGSRRSAESLISAGRVRVNGVAATLGMRVDAAADLVEVDGRRLTAEGRYVYLAMNKPSGYMTTARDPQHRRIVMELLPAGLPPHVLPVGRLDRDTEGLLIFTNDGELAHRLAHPRYRIDKEYAALVAGEPSARTLELLASGVTIDGRRTAPAQVERSQAPVGHRAEAGHTWLRLVLHEGRKRQVRVMCAAVGHAVRTLVRTRIDGVMLARQRRGDTRSLTRREVRGLRTAVGLEGEDMTQSARSARKPVSTIAIDGPAASGKSVVGAIVASRLGFRFFDTGAMYRAVTWAALTKGVDTRDASALTVLAERLRVDMQAEHAARVLVDSTDATPHLREHDVEANVSLVSSIAGVRAALVRIQRALAASGRVVMAGRDIGSVVLPDADLKVYLDASREIRARRRVDELRAAGREPDFDALLRDLARRDGLDSTREVSPLTAAAGAVIINTDDATIEQVVARIVELAS